ncbi:MAG: type II secretion system F family protein [Bacteroidetes bacterium]|nr:type II secretion system F family protein [Bacteroidota bacterium]
MAIEVKNIDFKTNDLSRGNEKGKGENKRSWQDILNRDITLFRKQFSEKNKERFYSELNILLGSGVDIKTALELIEEGQAKKADKEVFRSVMQHILKGGALSGALEKTGKFSPYEYFSVRIGEESGRLPHVLEELSAFYSRLIRQKRQFVSALSYPVIVVAAATAAVFFMLNFVVPMFSDVFKRFGGELPLLTRIIIDASGWLSLLLPYLLLVSVLCVAFILWQKRQEWFRKLSAAIILRVPLIGDIIRKLYLGRFCSSMNLLTAANTPLVDALALIEKMVSFYPLEKSLAETKIKVMKGTPLYQALSGYDIYDRRMISLVKVAEEVNQLDVIFGKLAKQYTDEVEYRTGMLGTTLEPILIVGIGLFVAVILIAMYLPLFQLGTMIK